MGHAGPLRWVAPGRIRQGYHCDCVLLPESLLTRMTAVSVGSMEEWVDSRLSDHCPVLIARTCLTG